MATNEIGIEVPAGTDPFDAQGDMVKMAASMRGRVVIPVANATDRAAVAASGPTPTSTDPLLVWRADAGAGLELEATTDGTTWRTYAASATQPWQQVTLGADFSHYETSGYGGLRACRNGGTAWLTGAVERKTGTILQGDVIGTLPSGMRPSVIVETATNGGAQIQILTNGNIVAGAATSAAVAVQVASWPVLL